MLSVIQLVLLQDVWIDLLDKSNHGGAARTAVEPQHYRSSIARSLITLDKDIVERSLIRSSLEISSKGSICECTWISGYIGNLIVSWLSVGAHQHTHDYH